jgi:two-component system response regulator HydG
MPRSTRAGSFVIAVTIALFVVSAGLQLFAERPIGLAGLVLDRSLRIAEGSRLPSPDLRVGDAVVAVNGLDVTTREELSFALRRAPERQALIRVELQGGEQTLLLDAADVAGDPPDALTGLYNVVTIGGVPPEAPLDFDEIRFRVMRSAPEPLELVIARGGRMEGSMAVAIGPPSAVAALWLLFGAIGATIAVLTNLAALHHGRRESRLGVLAAALAGVAAPAVASASLAESGALVVLVWGTTLAAAWRAYSFLFHVTLARGERALEPVHVLLVGGPGVAAIVTGIVFVTQGLVGNAPLDEAWRIQALQVSYAAVLLVGAFAVGDVLVHIRRRPGVGPTVGGVVSLLCLLVFGAAAFREGPSSVGGPALLWLAAAITAQWLGDLVPFVPFGERRKRRTAEGDEAGNDDGVAAILADAPAIFGERAVRVCVAIGGPTFVGVTRFDAMQTGDARLVAAVESDTVCDALAMLALERRSLPFTDHGDEDNPDALSGLAERLDWDAARPIPLGDDSGVDAYFVVESDPEGLHPAVDLDIADAFAARFADRRAVAELVAAASSELVQAARRAASPGADATPLPRPVPAVSSPSAASTAAVPAASPISTTGAWTTQAAPVVPRALTRRDAGWIEWLERAVTLEYPVDDPEALTDRERRGLRFIAESDKPALIVGEPGSGKELVARAIHRSSPRGRERVAVIDASLVPPSVVDLEIFGDRDHPGLSEVIDGGTIIVKSLSSVGPAHVDRLANRIATCGARAIFVERYLGNEGGVPRSVPDVIRQLADDRTLHIAPLRDRRADIGRLARYFLHRTAMRYGRIVVDLDDEAVEYLQDLEYPSNFHDLRALILAGVLRCPGERIRRSDVAPYAEPEADSAPMSHADEEREKAEILAALQVCDNNRSEAARRLGITRGKLLRRLARFGIQ